MAPLVPEGGMKLYKIVILLYCHIVILKSGSFDWIEKVNKRGLLKEKEYQHIAEELNKLPKEINHLINFTEEKLSI